MGDKRPFSTEAQNRDGGQNGRLNIQITNSKTYNSKSINGKLNVFQFIK